MDSKDEETSAPPENVSVDDEEVKEASIPRTRFWFLCLGVMLGLFLSMIDNSIVATSLYDIGVDFKELESINWVALSYTLANLGCAVVFARISDIVGRRNAFMVAFLFFFVFSLACGFAKSLNQLIAFRALQGIGGSGLFSLTMVILPELSPANFRQHIAALIGMVMALSGVLGPVLGGILTHYASWRWVFWINGPIGAVSITIFFLTWPKPEHLPTIERRSWKELDYAGSILAMAASVLVVFSFQNAGESSQSQWNKAVFLAPLLCGLASWVLLVAWQVIIDRRFTDLFAPAFPLILFRRRVYVAAVINGAILGFPYFLLLYAVPLRIQVVSEKSALTAGVMLLPMLGGAAVGSMLSGKINAVKNYVGETLAIGSCLMTLGCGLLSTLSHELDHAKLLGFLPFCGLGFGLTASASTFVTAIEAPIREYAPAQGILSQFRFLGGSLGIAASTAILHGRISTLLEGVLSPLEQAMIGSPDLHLTTTQANAVRYAHADAFRIEMWVATGIAASGILFALGAFHRRRPLVLEQRKLILEQEAARRREKREPSS